MSQSLSPTLAINRIVQEVWNQYRLDHPAVVRNLRSSAQFLGAVEGMAIARVLDEPDLVKLLKEGERIERTSYFWTRVVELVGEIIPQVLTKFA